MKIYGKYSVEFVTSLLKIAQEVESIKRDSCRVKQRYPEDYFGGNREGWAELEDGRILTFWECPVSPMNPNIGGTEFLAMVGKPV